MHFHVSAAAEALTSGDRIEAALALRAKGRHEEALDVLSGPGEFSQDVFTLRGDLQFELGRFQEAIGSYSTVIAFASDNLYAHYNLALCLRRLKYWEAAAAAFRQILAHDSHRDMARIELGDCLLQMSRAEEALSCFDACWTEAARGRALFGKAVALQMLRRFPEAEAAYERLLQVDPKAEEAQSNLIALGVELSDLVRIHRYSLRLLEVCPQSQIALQGLILVALERGEYEGAARYMTRLTKQASGGELRLKNDSRDAIQYRLSREMVERLNQIRSDRFESGVKPADRAMDSR